MSVLKNENWRKMTFNFLVMFKDFLRNLAIQLARCLEMTGNQKETHFLINNDTEIDLISRTHIFV